MPNDFFIPQPDYARNFRDAFQTAKQDKQRSNLEQLAGQYYEQGQANPGMLSQIARNGGNAPAFQEMDRSNNQNQAKDVAQFGQMFLSLPPDQKAAQYPEFVRRVNSLKMDHPPIPEQYNPSFDAGMQQFVQALAGQGQQDNLLPAEARTALFFQQHPELAKQEQERYKNRPFYDPSTGTLVYPQGAPGQSQPQAPQNPQAPQMQQASNLVLDDLTLQSLMAVPASERQTALAAMQASAQGKQFDMTPGANGQPTAYAPRNGPGVVQVGPTAGDKAYATEAGKTRASLDFAPQLRANDIATAGGKAAAEATAKSQAERDSKVAGRTQNAGTALDLLARAERLLPSATGSGLGAARDRVAGFFGKSTAGAKPAASLKTIAGQLILMQPRMEGPQSDADRKLYAQMAGDLGNESLPVDTRMAALQQMRSLQQKYQEQGNGLSDKEQSELDELRARFGKR